MTTKITRNIIESFLNCKYEGHLKLAGQIGIQSDYQSLLATSRDVVRRLAFRKISACHEGEDVQQDIALTATALQRGAAFLLNSLLEHDDYLALVFDGLMRVQGPSTLGDFHYVPVLSFEGRRICKKQRALLEVYGLLLSRLQGRMPAFGILWHGSECRPSRVRIGTDVRTAGRLLEELRHIRAGEASPQLVLNDHCAICEFRQRCHQQAVKEDNISLLRGVKEKEIKAYARKGILTVTQLAHTFRPRRKGKRAPPRPNRRVPALQALAVRDKRVYIFGTPQLPASPIHIYLDVEGNPEEDLDYLIGMIVVVGDREERHSFWAESKDQEQSIFEQFLAIVDRHDEFLIFSYGTYERVFLKKMRNQAAHAQQVDRVLRSLVNVLSLIYAHFYFPSYSNGLKAVGACLGCSWSDPDASGIQSIVWRTRWESTHNEEWLRKLTAYNLEDCAALKRVTEFLYTASAAIGKGTELKPSSAAEPSIGSVQDLDKSCNQRMWGKARFFHADFDFINDRAYFDYQRQRVFVRTSRTLRKNRRAASGTHINRKLKVNHHVEIVGPKCPACGGVEIIRWKHGRQRTNHAPRRKRAFDLVFTSGGIKRRVVECTTSVHECGGCGQRFVPERYERLAKHFHGLMSWVVFEHIAHRISYGILAEMLQETFGLAICSPEIHMIKLLMARYYQPGYKRLFNKILSGSVLHIDETQVKLRTGTGYVWVFASLEDVVLLYRPTREGNFLKDLLKDFRGVLVSDFYAAYDGIDCPRQKCLIHLLRDMNQDILNNPFDQELQSITGPFGILLREVVTTIDQHGLKRCHLKQHDHRVSQFFVSLEGQSFRSEVAEALRHRLLKYQNELFTFIQHDGIPWNNNNAENAIKQFAYYREDTVGIMKEEGLTSYLIMLSLCHTCRFRGISFLKFLCSRVRDIDSFSARGRRRQQRPEIEIYPKGFLPPHLARLHNKVTRQSGNLMEQVAQEGRQP